jgi:hypothetical protein
MSGSSMKQATEEKTTNITEVLRVLGEKLSNSELQSSRGSSL